MPIGSPPPACSQFLTLSCIVHCLWSPSPLLHLRFGDRDLDLAEANPLRLRALLEANEPEGAVSDYGGGDNKERRAGGWGVPVVLLHSCYPFMREAGYLASVYSKVSAGDMRTKFTCLWGRLCQ